MNGSRNFDAAMTRRKDYYIENDLAGLGVKTLHAKYIKTDKNAPVEKLFDGLVYSVTAKNDSETYANSLGHTF